MLVSIRLANAREAGNKVVGAGYLPLILPYQSCASTALAQLCKYLQN
jgi:hypothetical protein